MFELIETAMCNNHVFLYVVGDTDTAPVSQYKPRIHF